MIKTGETEKYTQAWVELYNKGTSIRAIASEYNVGKTLVIRAIKPHTTIREKSPNLQYAEEWHRLYLSGVTKADIAREYNVSPPVVGSILEKMGVEKEPKMLKYEHLEKAFIDLYESGLSLREIGDKFGIDRQTILNYLNRRGATVRDLSEASRTIPFNEDYFDVLCPENLFVLGMIYSIGNIVYDNQTARNLLLMSNREGNIDFILEKIERTREKELSLHDGIYFQEPIHSIKFVKRLMELGFHSSSNYEFPQLEGNELDRFIDGFMYADLEFEKKRNVFTFRFPSHKTKDKVLDYFERKDFFTRLEIKEETDTSFAIEKKHFKEKAKIYYSQLPLWCEK